VSGTLTNALRRDDGSIGALDSLVREYAHGEMDGSRPWTRNSEQEGRPC
jgi:hypothetical protein